MTVARYFRWTVLGALALAACNDQPTAPLPDQLVVTKPAGLVGAPGFPLIDTLFVRVLDAEGQPRAGVPVTWVVRDGGGSVLPLTDVSGTEGTAAAIWTLGPRPGYNELRVSISEEASHTFTATGEVFRASEVTGDWYHGCGLVDGAIWCWGRYSPVHGVPSSNYNPRGRGSLNNYAPALYDDAREYTDVTIAGSGRICALDSQGAVWCAPAYSNLPPEPVSGFPSIRRGTLNGSFVGGICGIAESDGRAWCWTEGVPAALPGSPALSVLRGQKGRLHCGLRGDSTAVCWAPGLTGDGSPMDVSGAHRFVELAIGDNFGCGRTAGGELWCWGSTYSAPVAPLDPALSATGIRLVGAEYATLMIRDLGGALIQGRGPWLVPEWENRPLEGLDAAAVTAFAENGTNCVTGAADEVYCVEEMWDPWDNGQDLTVFLPVMPVREPPPAPAVLR